MPEKLALLGVITFALGIALGTAYAVPFPFVAFLLMLGGLLLGAWFFARRLPYLLIAIALLALSLGAGRAALAPRTLPSAFVPFLDTKVELAGTVVGDPDLRENSQRIPVEVREGKSVTRILAVTDRYHSFAYGDRVTVSGTLTLPQSFDTDGGRAFAYDRFLAKDGIFALIQRATLTKAQEPIAGFAYGLRYLYGAKHRFAQALEDALPEPYASLAEGLITGGKQGLGKALLDAFTATGLLPIIVLSGYNVMIVAEAVLVAFGFLRRRYALTLAGSSVLLFVLAAGTGASALRAGLMAGLALYARATRRTYDALRALIGVFVLMLLTNPLLFLADPGFQFSFAATLGLILLTTPIAMHFTGVPFWFAEVLASTSAAQLMVLPLLLYQTGNLSLVAIPANLLVLPVIPATMAASAFAALIALRLPALGAIVGLPAYALLAYIVSVAETLARVPLASVIVPAFSAWFLVPAYAGIGWLAVRLIRSQPKGVIRSTSS